MFVCLFAWAGEKKNELFSTMMHQWAIQNSGTFSNLIRHVIDRDDLFDEMVNKLIVRATFDFAMESLNKGHVGTLVLC